MPERNNYTQLDIEGFCVAANGSDALVLEGRGSTVVVHADNITVCLSLLDGVRASLDRFQTFFLRADVDLDVHVEGRLVGRLGPSARPGIAGRLLGVPSMEIRVLPAALAWLLSKLSRPGMSP